MRSNSVFWYVDMYASSYMCIPLICWLEILVYQVQHQTSQKLDMLVTLLVMLLHEQLSRLSRLIVTHDCLYLDEKCNQHNLFRQDFTQLVMTKSWYRQMKKSHPYKYIQNLKETKSKASLSCGFQDLWDITPLNLFYVARNHSIAESCVISKTGVTKRIVLVYHQNTR